MSADGTLRTGGDDAARRAGLGVARGTLVAANDSTKMQEVTVRDFFGKLATHVEHWHPYGLSHVPLPPKDEKEAEVLVAHLGGSPDHPVVIATADRRHRPKNMKPGESAVHDDQKQHVHLTRGGVNATGKKVTVTAGDKPETKDHELNEQLKGLVARLGQIEDSHHAMHDVVSKLRENVEQVVPALAPINLATQVTGALNGQPGGLEAMKAFAEGKLKGYLQNALQRGLATFLNPGRLLGMTSLLGGGVEGLIQGLQGQIAGLIASNPAVAQVDDLADELFALAESGNLPGVIAQRSAELRGQIAALTGANPVIGQVAQLRGALQALLDQAGPGLNFLEPQKRLAQGLTKAMRFGGPG